MIALLTLLLLAPSASAQTFAQPQLFQRVSQRLAGLDTDKRFQRALTLLETTPTGKRLLAPVHAGKVRVALYDDGSVHYTDALDEVHYSRDYVRDSEVWQTAVILAHELEHARQDRLGLNGDGVRGAREAAAFQVQCRVWVELGGKVREPDLGGNRMNSQDMLGWLDHPKVVVDAILLRSTLTLDMSRPDLRRYWQQVQSDEAAWRARWRPLFPPADSAAAAAFVVRQAQRYRADHD